MAKTALDTSVVVAAHQSWHKDHAAALASLQRILGSEEEELLLATRVLVESFSVMTRLPAPYRLKPEEVLQLLVNTFEGKAVLIDQPPETYWDSLRTYVARGASGGSVYDAEIIECSRQAGATKILTFNLKHFERLAPSGIEILSPYDDSN